MGNGLILNDQYNIGHICTRQQVEAGRGEKVAMRFITPAMERVDYTFRDLDLGSSRFANVLAGLGFAPADIFFTFLPKMPEQFFAFLGALKAQVIAGTLFSNFGEEALLDRLGDSRAKGIITKKHFLKKLNRIWEGLPELKYIILVDIDDDLAPNVLSYRKLMEAASDRFTAPLTGPPPPLAVPARTGFPRPARIPGPLSPPSSPPPCAPRSNPHPCRRSSCPGAGTS